MTLLGKVAEPSGSRTWLKEVGHQGEGLEVLPPLPVHSPLPDCRYHMTKTSAVIHFLS